IHSSSLANGEIDPQLLRFRADDRLSGSDPKIGFMSEWSTIHSERLNSQCFACNKSAQSVARRHLSHFVRIMRLLSVPSYGSRKRGDSAVREPERDRVEFGSILPGSWRAESPPL